MRLQKYLAHAGIASRRACEEIIASGRVCVNGSVADTPGITIMPGDSVSLDGKPVLLEAKKVYIAMNKPNGYMTTAKDTHGRKTVLDLLEGVYERVYPVGRLDLDSEGLLILTNDGEFANSLTHPSFETEKKYMVYAQGTAVEGWEELLKKGVMLEDGITLPAGLNIFRYKSGSAKFEITIKEGRKRQIRRMCNAVGLKVIRLIRLNIGGLKLGNLAAGEWRYLEKPEIDSLMQYALNKKMSDLR